MKLLSVQEYAATQSKTRQWVLWMISQGKELPNVKLYQKVGKAWVLLMIC